VEAVAAEEGGLLLESRWQRRRFFCREKRERKRGTVIGGEVTG
jgi:hypothetical protein